MKKEITAYVVLRDDDSIMKHVSTRGLAFFETESEAREVWRGRVVPCTITYEI